MRATMHSLNGMAGAGLLLASVSLSFLCGFGASAEEPANLLSNPGAETQISADEAAKKINFNYMLNNDFLELADTVPDGWGMYDSANCKMKWGSSDKEFHSGKYSCCLTLVDPLKGDKKWMYERILLGGSNGVSGGNAIQVVPGADYAYSFWVKGDAASFSVDMVTWNTEDAKSGAKFSTIQKPDALGAEWKQVSGACKPPADAKRMLVGIRLLAAEPGQSMYVDDAVITAKPAAAAK